MADIERVRHAWPFPAIKPDARDRGRREAPRAPAGRKPEHQSADGGKTRRGRKIDEYA